MDKGILKLLKDVFGDTLISENNDSEPKEEVCCDDCQDSDDTDYYHSCWANLTNNDDIDKTYDLTKDDDYNKFVDDLVKCEKDLNELENENDLVNSFFKVFFGDDLHEWLDKLKNEAECVHNEAKEKEEKVEAPELPSKSVSAASQTNIHKLVGEYVDNYIRPFGNFDNKTINDVYAGLFEFACWLLKK